jgi:hypothetical protein
LLVFAEICLDTSHTLAVKFESQTAGREQQI